MLKLNSTTASLVVAAVAAGVVALSVEHWSSSRATGRTKAEQGAAMQAVGMPATAANRGADKGGVNWSASAPGRVEPRDGEVRIGAQMPGKVAQVLVRMNDAVKAGDLLVRLADEEQAAKLSAALAEVSVRRRERDGEPANKIVAERRAAEDIVSVSERNVFRARTELDRLQINLATGVGTAKERDGARVGLTEANDKLESDRANLRRVLTTPGLPLPTRLESGLATARAELALVETALERTRIRAPADGTVLQVNTRAGETVSPSPEDVLVSFGDLTTLRVRAEIEERDVAKIRVGQMIVVRSDAYPGQEFTGKVDRMAQSLGAPRIASKGPRRPNEQDVLQVLIDLDGRPALLPGMRVDVFFRPDLTSGSPGAAGIRPN